MQDHHRSAQILVTDVTSQAPDALEHIGRQLTRLRKCLNAQYRQRLPQKRQGKTADGLNRNALRGSLLTILIRQRRLHTTLHKGRRITSQIKRRCRGQCFAACAAPRTLHCPERENPDKPQSSSDASDCVEHKSS